MSTDKRTGHFYCDFCGKGQHEVEILIRGPMVKICDECIVLAQVRVEERRAERVMAAAISPGGAGEGEGVIK